jgi:alpha-1,2-mannosyltransferase
MTAPIPAMIRRSRIDEFLDLPMAVFAACILVAGTLAMWVWTFTSGSGLFDGIGRPIGTDFSSFWAAGQLALSGEARAVYDPDVHFAAQKAVFGPDYKDYYGFFYPPTFLLMSAALGALPYLWSLVLWQAGGMAFYYAALRQMLPKNWKMAALIFGFPCVFLALGHGQNSFLTTGLFTFGLLNLKRRPVFAGICFGLLAYKPQLALLVPIAVVATANWRAFIAAGVTAFAFLGLSAAVLGIDIFTAYTDLSATTRTALLENGGPGWHKLQSLFAVLRSVGIPVSIAYIAQAAVSLLSAVLVWHIWRSKADYLLKMSTLCVASLLATPFVLDYDLLLLAPALAAFASLAHQTGWRAHEKWVLAFVFTVPLYSRVVAEVIYLPLGFLSLIALAIIIWRRHHSSAQANWHSIAA